MYGLQKTVVGLRQYRPVQQYLSCEEGSKTKPRTSYDPHRDLVREDLGVETYGPKHCSSHLSSVISAFVMLVNLDTSPLGSAISY